MIRIVLAAAGAALLVSGCGAAGGKAAVVARCVKEDGQTQKVCECMADKTEKVVDKDVWRAIVLEAEGKTAESQKLMESLPLDKQFSAMGAAAAAFECMGGKPS